MTNIERVLNAKIDEEIFLKNNYIYKIKFTIERLERDEPKYNAGAYYFWTAYSNDEKWNSIFPMLTYGMDGYVKLFKTLNGAKRNFIKRYLKEDK